MLADAGSILLGGVVAVIGFVVVVAVCIVVLRLLTLVLPQRDDTEEAATPEEDG